MSPISFKITYSITLSTLLGELIFITGYTDNFVITWDKTLGSDWLLTNHTAETVLMPLFALVLKLFHACKHRI